MLINIVMPALSPTMEKGTLAKWLKTEGETVKPGDVIAEIETDKATMEVEAVDAGVLKILVPAGATDIPVNQVIAVLAGEGEDSKAIPARNPQAVSVPLTKATAAKGPVADIATSVSQPTGVAVIMSPSNRDGQGVARIFASPFARRLAKEAGINLAGVTGTGPQGRVIAQNIEAAIARAQLQTMDAAAPGLGVIPSPVTALSDQKIVELFEPGSYEVIPHDTMRKIIARRLIESKLTIPHFYLTIDCTLDKLLTSRGEFNAAAPIDQDGKSAYRLSVNDFVIKALAMALIEVPDANVTWTESSMLRHRHSDIGVAVAIPGGLVTPVIRRAESKALSVISREMKDLAALARARKLQPHQYQGGSTAISNLGMFGVKEFAAVINPPHATILAVGCGEERAVVHDSKIEVATIMTVTLSTDHRAVDGVVGAELLAAFKHLIEQPLRLVI